MFPTYAIIGALLTITGIIYAYYFFYYLKVNRDDFSIIALSDSLLTFVIGLFYVSAAIILSKPEVLNELNGLQNFTNNIEDLAILNFNFHNEGKYNKTEMNFNSESEDTEKITTTEKIYTSEFAEMVEITTINNEEIITEPEESITLPDKTKNDHFLANYQNFIKQFLKQKLNNATLNINKETMLDLNRPQVTRQKREIQNSSATEEQYCFNQVFYNDALLLYSFVHCLMNLLNGTRYCKKCIKDDGNTETSSSNNLGNVKEKEVPANGQEDKTDVQTSVVSDNGSEKSDSAAPVGSLVSDIDRSVSDLTPTPNIELFQAKCQSQNNPVKNDDIKERELENNYKYVTKIIISWLLPLLSAIILYFIINYQMKFNDNTTMLPISVPNFNSTRINSNLMHIMYHPNVTNSSIVDNIVNNVYEIVNEVQRNTTDKVTPGTIDILHLMNHQKRIPKQKNADKCTKQNTFLLKLFYFFIFLTVFLGVIFYGKIIQIIASTKNSTYAGQLNNSIIYFSAMWVPSIADVLFRTFFNGNSIGILSDIFLFLGNSNQFYNMISNYNQCKKNKKCNTISPLP